MKIGEREHGITVNRIKGNTLDRRADIEAAVGRPADGEGFASKEAEASGDPCTLTWDFVTRREADDAAIRIIGLHIPTIEVAVGSLWD